MRPPYDELRLSDAQLRATLNAAFDAIVTMDAEGMIIGVNPAAEAMFGATAEDLLGQEVAEAIVPPHLREPHRKGLERYIETRATRVSGHPVMLTAMRADGTEFPVEVAIRRLEIPGPPVFTGFIRDLTARLEAEAEIRLLADEQAALRRVATLVAQGADPAAVFAAVTKEVAGLFAAATASLVREQDDGSALVVGDWTRGETVDAAHEVSAPVQLDGEFWGAIIVGSEAEPFPDGTEERLQAFAELVAQAIANTEAREQLAASRARLVTAHTTERRRLERNLHDGAQQRLVSLALRLRIARKQLDSAPERVGKELDGASEELSLALAELREISRGLHPAVLTDHGLEAAITSVCSRATVPVDVDVDVDAAPAEPLQAAAYYVVAEALTNVAKYAHASSASVCLRATGSRLEVDVRDDGVGGADQSQGSGLSGLTDRVEALGGRLEIESPPGEGTRIRAELPL